MKNSASQQQKPCNKQKQMNISFSFHKVTHACSCMHAQCQSTGSALPTDLVNFDLSSDEKWHKASVQDS